MTRENVFYRAAANGDVRSGGAREADERTFSIGDLSREFGVTLRTLRFYEDRALLAPRRKGTIRVYSARDRSRLVTILKGKRLGFTLGEIAGMVAVEEGSTDAPGVLKLSLHQVEEQIVHLERQKVEIEGAIAELRVTRDGLTARLAAE